MKPSEIRIRPDGDEQDPAPVRVEVKAGDDWVLAELIGFGIARFETLRGAVSAVRNCFFNADLAALRESSAVRINDTAHIGELIEAQVETWETWNARCVARNRLVDCIVAEYRLFLANQYLELAIRRATERKAGALPGHPVTSSLNEKDHE